MPRLFVSLMLLAVLAGGTIRAQDKPKDKEKEPEKQPEPMKKKRLELIGGKTLPEWIKEIGNTDPSVRREAMMAVLNYGDESEEAVPAVVKVLKADVDATLRSLAAIVLQNIEVRDSQVPSVLEALIWQLKNTQINVRYHCAITLGRFAEDAQKAVPALIEATKDVGSWEVRQAACNSLSSVYSGKKLPPDKDGLHNRAYIALAAAMGDPASKVRMQALLGLLAMGTPGETSVKNHLDKVFLERLQNERDRSIVVWTYYGLMINNKVTDVYLNAIGKYLDEGDVPTRIQAIRAMGMLIRETKASKAKERLPRILALTRDSDPMVACTACMTLSFIHEKLDTGDHTIASLKALSEEKDFKKVDRIVVNVAKFAHDKMTKKETVVKPDKKAP